ncbi:hypothetical protein H920_11284 [Fukomys damarensis]|uniref:Uncharacterized protein n=1 Tax=Fukomys damarensis TaxID=885580 RepID=A0A091D8C5_FUKDA|nr:hypothetical protein H920_11284 [Fukomys damarensis]
MMPQDSELEEQGSRPGEAERADNYPGTLQMQTLTEAPENTRTGTDPALFCARQPTPGKGHTSPRYRDQCKNSKSSIQ